MSDINIKVTPAELEARANEFRNVMNQTNTLTADMMKTIMGLSSVWTGSASEEYISQFKGLQKDMDKMGELINNHVTDLP
ncbi:MAG: WXG100 family type VII secretion target [Coprococcus sp.]